MLPVIVAFDPELPIVVSQEVSIGGRTFAPETPFPWKEIGLDVVTLHSLYRSGYVRCESAQIVAPTKPQQRSRAAR